jgi:hypothetical protein
LPADLVAFVAIAVAMLAIHRPFIRHGMSFNDPTWYFHFGQRTLAGDVPYRDYVFQVGPLPIYMDAAFQAVFGAKYAASLYAALLVKILRVFVIWMIARRLAGARAAALLCVFCALDPMFSFAHHWSTSYAELFFTLGGLFLLLARRAAEAGAGAGAGAGERRVRVHLVLAGCATALVLSARQASVVTIGMLLLVATAILLARKQFFTPARFIALWAGFAAGVLLVLGFLAAIGALEPAIRQMFLEAAEKKAVGGLHSFLDAISGGAFVVYLGSMGFSWWSGPLHYLGLSMAIVLVAARLGGYAREVSLQTVGVLLLPSLLVLGLFLRFGSLEWVTDLPRMFLSVTTAVAVLSYERARRWFGLDPIVAIGLGALPLASDWALEMSFPGRGWGDVWGLCTGLILVSLATSHVGERAKQAICAALAAAGLLHFAVHLAHDTNPFGKFDANDGTLTENSRSPHILGERRKVFWGLRVTEWRAQAVEWLGEEVPPGATCFIYANLPSLYDVLGCTNPTRVDTTIVDFPSRNDANAVAAVLRASPPDFILAHEKMWMSPPISLDLSGKLENYESWNPPATMAIHLGLRAIIEGYEDRGLVADKLGPELAARAAKYWDRIDQVRLYRRRR